MGKNYLLHASQVANFPDVLDFLHGITTVCPVSVTQFNLFIDDNNLIHTNCKLKRLQASFLQRCPILLHPNCPITKSIIIDAHEQLGHSGIYRVMHFLKQDFWINRIYTTIRKNISSCILCKRLNGRTIKVNTNDYRASRVAPEAIPFRCLLLDYIGPFTIKNFEGKSQKMYILILTCYWSRAINLLVCDNLDTPNFLRALQLHIFDFGIPSLITSDNGSQIVQGVHLFHSVLKQPAIINYCNENKISLFQFEPYPAGSSKLGGAVESLVKQVKNLMKSCTGQNVLNIRDFEFLVKEAMCIINKRPVAYKNNLTSSNVDTLLDSCITPERLIKGFDVPSMSILAPISDTDDPDFILTQSDDEVWLKVLKSTKKMSKIRSRLQQLYFPEFLATLQLQASNRKSRYRVSSHISLEVGDLVSIKEPLSKPFDFPMAIVVEIETNSAGEVNTATLRKANKVFVRRHVEDIILLLKGAMPPESLVGEIPPDTAPSIAVPSGTLVPTSAPTRVRRAAALECDRRNRILS